MKMRYFHFKRRKILFFLRLSMRFLTFGFFAFASIVRKLLSPVQNKQRTGYSNSNRYKCLYIPMFDKKKNFAVFFFYYTSTTHTSQQSHTRIQMHLLLEWNISFDACARVWVCCCCYYYCRKWWKKNAKE